MCVSRSIRRYCPGIPAVLRFIQRRGLIHIHYIYIYIYSVRNSIEPLNISEQMCINRLCSCSLNSLIRISFGGRVFINTTCLAQFTQQSLLSLTCS